jgi:farnesyl-diphosphate farnesyltransferase
MSGAQPSSGGLPAVSSAERRRLLTDLLKGVSRSFYLTLKVLPSGVREPVGLAYLLARSADTISDTRVLPSQDRLKHLLEFRAQVVGPADFDALQNIGNALNDLQEISKEAELLRSLPAVFGILDGLPSDDQQAVRAVVVTLMRGMETDLTTFPTEDSGQVVALDSPQALDDYIYYVAGCVGEFWTAVSLSHTASLRHWDKAAMSALGVRFGKALQMTNVLRDVPKDLRMGRCYLTAEALSELGLNPSDLLNADNSDKARPALVDGINLALDHYAAAKQYILAIPRRNLRLRLAALWPVVIGLGTLAQLADNRQWLSPDSISKVTRGWIYKVLLFSMLVGRSNRVLTWWIRRLRKGVESAL